MSNITVIGAGMMGSAISIPAALNGHRVKIVGTPLDRDIIAHAKNTGEHLTMKRKLPDGIEYYNYEQFDEAVKDADLLICGVSSFGLDWFLDSVICRIPDGMSVLSITKGMLHPGRGEMISYPEAMEQKAESLGKNISFNAVGGPCTSYELADRDPTEVTFCGRDMARLREIKAMFETDFYHISLSTDVRGVECAVALKNAYALGVSLAIGMAYKREGREIQHYNSQAALFAQSLREMQRLLELAGGGAENLLLGAGDLYVTVYGGRTRKIGILLGEGIPFDEAMKTLSGVTLESVVLSGRTADAVRALIAEGREKAENFPLLLHIDDLIGGRASVNIPWDSFESECE